MTSTQISLEIYIDFWLIEKSNSFILSWYWKGNFCFQFPHSANMDYCRCCLSWCIECKRDKPEIQFCYLVLLWWYVFWFNIQYLHHHHRCLGLDCLYGFVWTPGLHFCITSQVSQAASCWSIVLGYNEIFIYSTLGFFPAHFSSFYSLLHTDVQTHVFCWRFQKTSHITELRKSTAFHIYMKAQGIHTERIRKRGHQTCCSDGEVGGAVINLLSSSHPTGLQISSYFSGVD